MLSEDEKNKLANRLRRVTGQVTAVQRMIEEEASCVDILTQIAAANGALGKVKQILLESHIKSGFANTLQGNNKKDQERKIDELIDLLQRYGRSD